MYQQYLKDPDSVDKAWWDFFADYKPSDSQAPTSTNGTTADKTPNEPGAAPVRTPTDGSAGRASDVRSNGATERSEGESASESRREATSRPAATESASARERESASQPRREPAAAPSTSPLRGAAARVVTNMEASLAVPTATSVRAIPAKLLIDNRVVINNHLRRGRGGKVSFTHIIGFALVRALADFPVMNRAFTPVDGKPAVSSPDHVNLGLAIDLA
jgi:2-oxoglutarate dehydrogenase E1 component